MFFLSLLRSQDNIPIDNTVCSAISFYSFTKNEILNLDSQITFPLKFNSAQRGTTDMTISSVTLNSPFQEQPFCSFLPPFTIHHPPSMPACSCLLPNRLCCCFCRCYLLLFRFLLCREFRPWQKQEPRSLNIYVRTYFNWIEGFNLSSLYEDLIELDGAR